MKYLLSIVVLLAGASTVEAGPLRKGVCACKTCVCSLLSKVKKVCKKCKREKCGC